MNLQVLKGGLLGDCYMRKCKSGPNSYSFMFQQSEFDYALWKAHMCNVPFTLTKRKRFDKRTSKYYHIYSVYLKMNKTVKKELFNSFYSPKKEVTKSILDSLSPLAIAIWYMDDGNMYYNGNNCHVTLAINGFNEESKDNIILFFKEKYNLNFKKSSNAIRITSRRETEIFMKIVEKFIPKCMKRKLFKYQFIKYDKTLTDERRKYRNRNYK